MKIAKQMHINPINPAMVKVIRDVRDGRLDYYIPLKRAKELYNDHKLFWDVTNHSYLSSNGDMIK